MTSSHLPIRPDSPIRPGRARRRTAPALSALSALAALSVLSAIALGCARSPATPAAPERPANGAPEAPSTAAPASDPPVSTAESDSERRPYGPGTLVREQFDSPALGVAKRYHVYLPPGYETGDGRYPTVYLLHGLTGSENSYLDLDIGATAAAVGLDAIVVMPDGDDGFYVNWATQPDYPECLAGKRPFGHEDDMRTYCVEHARYHDYLVNDLVPHIDARYRTIASPASRAIAGLSMGGYGALVTAFRHTDMFGAVASHAGVDTLLYKGPIPYQRGEVELFADPAAMFARMGPMGGLFRPIFGDDIAYWRARDPAILAEKLAPDALAIYLDCGTEDEFRLQHGASYLHEVLERRKVPHAFHLIEGGHHDGAFWRARIDDSLRFLAEFFARAG